MLAITNADIQSVANILMIVGGIVAVGGLAWGVYKKVTTKDK